jgi:multidrug efflux pump subunit AcrB
VWHTSSDRVTDAAVKQRMTVALKEIARSPGVAAVLSPYTARGAGEISGHGTTAYATVDFTASKPAGAVTKQVEKLAVEARAQGLDVQLGGSAFAVTPSGSPIADSLGIAVAAVILFLMFRSAWAAALPILTAIAGVGAGLASIMLLSHLTSIADTAISLGSLIGLGVGIDYALFIVNRHRKNLMTGMSVPESVAKALNTSGRAVLFAGLTVIIALLGMFTLGMTLLNGMALGAAVTVALTVLSAVTLLPALLSFLGLRVLSPQQRRRLAEHVAHAADPSVRRHGFWGIPGPAHDGRQRRLGTPRCADAPRTPGDGPGGPRTVQRRHRRTALRHLGHREDARQPGRAQARRPGPRPTGRDRLRDWSGPGRYVSRSRPHRTAGRRPRAVRPGRRPGACDSGVVVLFWRGIDACR